MDIKKSERGFEFLEHRDYPHRNPKRLVSQSSIVLDYDDALDRPGSSALWVGDNHHLDRKSVEQLVCHLQAWLSTGSLRIKVPEKNSAKESKP